MGESAGTTSLAKPLGDSAKPLVQPVWKKPWEIQLSKAIGTTGLAKPLVEPADQTLPVPANHISFQRKLNLK